MWRTRLDALNLILLITNYAIFPTELIIVFYFFLSLLWMYVKSHQHEMLSSIKLTTESQIVPICISNTFHTFQTILLQSTHFLSVKKIGAVLCSLKSSCCSFVSLLDNAATSMYHVTYNMYHSISVSCNM